MQVVRSEIRIVPWTGQEDGRSGAAFERMPLGQTDGYCRQHEHFKHIGRVIPVRWRRSGLIWYTDSLGAGIKANPRRPISP